jgi:hypothetical protein
VSTRSGGDRNSLRLRAGQREVRAAGATRQRLRHQVEARFSIISSHGDVIGTDQRPVDRVVDGAYFDYSGIVSAMELRIQITRLDDQLRPFVLFLTNDPGFNPRACEGGTVPDELDDGERGAPQSP